MMMLDKGRRVVVNVLMPRRRKEDDGEDCMNKSNHCNNHGSQRKGDVMLG